MGWYSIAERELIAVEGTTVSLVICEISASIAKKLRSKVVRLVALSFCTEYLKLVMDGFQNSEEITSCGRKHLIRFWGFSLQFFRFYANYIFLLLLNFCWRFRNDIEILYGACWVMPQYENCPHCLTICRCSTVIALVHNSCRIAGGQHSSYQMRTLSSL